MLEKQLQTALDRRRQRGTLRRLTNYETTSDHVHSNPTPADTPTLKGSKAKRLIDFSSNDYMGLAHSTELKSGLISKLQGSSRFPLGSTGSRLLDGNSSEHEQVSAD
jgi:7-keto-8-aminopelargonate synthetase-like enzyme